MRIVVTVHDLGIGGTQTYALTVAEQLERLGHETTIHAGAGGPMAEIVRERGVALALTEDELPAAVDALITQDGAMAYRMAERLPSTPQLFRGPSDLFDLQLPPQLPGVVGAVMAVSDRCARRLGALAAGHDVIRLRQPIDTERFADRGAIRTRPRRAVLLGGYLSGGRLEALRDAWQGAGVECVQVASMLAPEAAIADADIVVAKGKAALEGMACGRAVFVYDQFGCDGWVTTDSYSAIEADNFAGQATDAEATPAAVRAALDHYDPAMGAVNRDLVTGNHSARRHAAELVDILRGLAPRAPAPQLPLRELARLVRVQWATESRAYRQALENTALHARLIEVDEARETAQLAAIAAERRYSDLLATRRHRVASAVGRLADRARSRT
jgi:hypothetical protein